MGKLVFTGNIMNRKESIGWFASYIKKQSEPWDISLKFSQVLRIFWWMTFNKKRFCFFVSLLEQGKHIIFAFRGAKTISRRDI